MPVSAGMRLTGWRVLLVVLIIASALAILVMWLVNSRSVTESASPIQTPLPLPSTPAVSSRPAREFYHVTTIDGADCFELPLNLVIDWEIVAKQSNLGADHTRTTHLRDTFLFDEREKVARVPYEAPVPSEVKAQRWVLIRADGLYDVKPDFIHGEIIYEYNPETESFSEQRIYAPGLACVRPSDKRAASLFSTEGVGEFLRRDAVQSRVDVMFEIDGKVRALRSDMKRWPEITAFVFKDPEGRDYLVAGWQDRPGCEPQYEISSLEREYSLAVIEQIRNCPDLD